MEGSPDVISNTEATQICRLDDWPFPQEIPMQPSGISVLFFDLGDTLVRPTAGWVDGAQQAIDTLLTRGLRLGIISNTANFSRSQLAALLPPDFDFQRFDQSLVLLSSEIGVEKPSPQIFRLAVERSGVPAAGCLFCGESLFGDGGRSTRRHARHSTNATTQ